MLTFLLASLLLQPAPPMPKGAPATQPATQPATEPATDPAAQTQAPDAPATEAASDITLDGLFVPAKPSPVELELKALTGPFTVAEAIEHGQKVKQGDVLLRLEAEDAAEQLEAAERALRLAEAELKAAEAQAKLGGEADRFEIATAERNVEQARQALSWFEEADGKNLLYSADFAVRSNLDSIADSEEELEQLRKMYKSEELTSDTADIVVKRALRQLEQLKERQPIIEQRSKKQRDFDYNVQRQQHEDNIVRQEQGLQQVRVQNELEAVRREADLATKRIAAEKAREALADLRADQEALTVKAPIAGTAYHGQMGDDGWQGVDPQQFAAGTDLQPQGTLMTVVPAGNLQVRAALPEEQRYDLSEGDTVRVEAAAGGETFRGTVRSIAPLPMQKGPRRVFAVLVDVDSAQYLAPGFGATVRLERPAASAVRQSDNGDAQPAAAILGEDPATRPAEGEDVYPTPPVKKLIEDEAAEEGAPATRPFDGAAAADAQNPYLQPVRRRDSIDAALADGVAFLIASQNDDGSWGTGLETRGTEIYSMVPGSHDAFRVATTALCAMAQDDAGRRDSEAYRKAIRYLVENGQARRDDARILYNIWANTYGLEVLSRELQRRPDDAAVKEAALWHLKKLRDYEVYVGGWNYYDFDAGTQRPSMEATSFGTAAGPGALHEAKAAGLDVPQPLIDRAVKRLAEMRTPMGTYLYSGSLKYMPQLDANRERGAVGRTQSAVWALALYGHPQGAPAMADEALTLLKENHAWLNTGRKRPYPHEAWYQTSGYYYYFAMYHAGLLVEDLTTADAGAARKHAEEVTEMILPYQEHDGSWWDYAMWDYHKPYGTAYAVMSLLRLKDAGA